MVSLHRPIVDLKQAARCSEVVRDTHDHFTSLGESLFVERACFVVGFNRHLLIWAFVAAD